MKTPTLLLVISLLACNSASAEEFTTSSGVRQLPLLASVRTGPAASEAARAAENVLAEMLVDVSASERERSALIAESEAIASKLKSEQAPVDKVSAHFLELDGKYKADYAAFQQATTDLEAEAARERADAATLEALPSAQRAQSEVARINKWADVLSSRRAELDRTRAVLLQDYEKVEAERQLPAQAKAEAEARLTKLREPVQGRINAHNASESPLYAALKKGVAYMNRVREVELSTSGHSIGHSHSLDEATERLQAYAARSRH